MDREKVIGIFDEYYDVVYDSKDFAFVYGRKTSVSFDSTHMAIDNDFVHVLIAFKDIKTIAIDDMWSDENCISLKVNGISYLIRLN